MRRKLLVTAAAAAATLVAAPAGAHENRLIAGKYRFTVGWGEEPAYAGFMNGVSLGVADATGRPVTDIGDSLTVEVSTGGRRVVLPLSQASTTSGEYSAPMVPTRPGNYTFKFTGSIHGNAINESFMSSETTFDEIKDPKEVAFPAKDPSTGELAERVDRETRRLTSAAKDASDDAASARTFGIVGIALGAVGIALGGRGLARRR